MLTVRYRWLELRAGERMLDFGCGGGRHSFEAMRRGAVAVAVDSDREVLTGAAVWVRAMLEEDKETAEAGGHGDLVAGDGAALPFPDGCFDRVIAAEVLEHVPDDARVLAELARVLRPGGLMAVTVPRWYPEAVNWALSSEYHNVPGGHVRIYRHSQLRRRLRKAGLDPSAGTTMRTHSTARTGGSAAPLGSDSESNPVVKAYHRLLVWDITAKNPAHPLARSRAQPRARQEPRRLCPQALQRGPGKTTGANEADRAVSALAPAEIRQTADWIATVQLPDGMVPWYRGGHADPWNHVEATMALAAGGRWAEVERAFEWLASKQLPDGSWCAAHVPGGVIEPRRDPNMCAYVATGAWWCAQLSGNTSILAMTCGRWSNGQSRGACATSARGEKSRGRLTPTACPASFALLDGQFVPPALAGLRRPGRRAPRPRNRRLAPGRRPRPGWRTPWPPGPNPSSPKLDGRWTGTTRS